MKASEARAIFTDLCEMALASLALLVQRLVLRPDPLLIKEVEQRGAEEGVREDVRCTIRAPKLAVR